MRRALVLASVVAALLVAVPHPIIASAGPDQAAPTCLGVEATIVGTAGPDSITGTSDADVIAALGGADSVRGGGGQDIICAGRGSDEVRGHGDLVGGAGDDELQGSYLVDRFYGGRGDDIMRGGPVLEGGGYQPDEVRFTLAARGVIADLAKGTVSGEGTDELHGIEDVYGSPHADVLIGTGGTRFVTGGGDDSVIGAEGTYDQLDFRPAPNGVQVDLGSGRASGWGNLTITGIDNINGSYHDDRLIGDDRRNEIVGDRGTDHLQGSAGRDLLFEACNCGGLGPVEPEDFRTDGSVLGGPGKDWLFGTHGDNTLGGGPGKDLLFGLLGDDIIAGGEGGLDVAHFGGSYDRYYTSEPIVFGTWLLDHAVSVDLTAGTAQGQGSDKLHGIEGALGSDRDDTLVGDPMANRLWGLGGNDTLKGEGGDDVLNGGPFVDACTGSSEARRLECEH